MSGPILTLNPNDLKENEKPIFFELLNSPQNNGFLFENTLYTLAGDQDVMLTENLLCAKNNNNKQTYFGFSFKDQIGLGGFTMVFKPKYKLQKIDQELISSNAKYAIKLQKTKKDEEAKLAQKFGLFNDAAAGHTFINNLSAQLNLINKYDEFSRRSRIPVNKFISEFDLTKENGTRIKSPLIVGLDDAHNLALTPVEYIPGRELYDVILEDETKQHFLSTEARINIILALLRAYKKQVYDKKIVHRDLKPENILIDLDPTTDEIKNIRIIDFNLSKHFDEYSDDICGSLDYLPPEIFNFANVDYKADLYMLGKIIALLMRNQPGNARNAKEAYDKSHWIDFSSLYSGIKDISNFEKIICDQIIFGMTKVNPTERLSIDHLINLAEELKLQYAIRKSSSSEHEITEAHKIATDAWHSLNQIEIEAKKGSDILALCDSMNECMTNAFQKLDDDVNGWQHFLAIADIKSIQKTKNKFEAQAIINNSLTNIKKSINDVKEYTNIDDMKEKYGKYTHTPIIKLLQDYVAAYHTFVNSYQQLDFTIDNLGEINSKIKKAQDKFAALRSQIEIEEQKLEESYAYCKHPALTLQAKKMRLFSDDIKSTKGTFSNSNPPTAVLRI